MSTPYFPRHHRKKPRSRFGWLIPAVGILGVIGIIVTVAILYFSSGKVQEGCVVDSKERTTQVSGGGDGNPVSSNQVKYVYTSCGVFTVDDNFYLLRFNSADLYGSLKEGESYNLHTIGWRNGFLSWFPNVLEAELVP